MSCVCVMRMHMCAAHLIYAARLTPLPLHSFTLYTPLPLHSFTLTLLLTPLTLLTPLNMLSMLSMLSVLIPLSVLCFAVHLCSSHSYLPPYTF